MVSQQVRLALRPAVSFTAKENNRGVGVLAERQKGPKIGVRRYDDAAFASSECKYLFIRVVLNAMIANMGCVMMLIF